MIKLDVTYNDTKFRFGWIAELGILVFAIFAVLKVMAVIPWSWWYVCSPLLAIPAAVGLFFVTWFIAGRAFEANRAARHQRFERRRF